MGLGGISKMGIVDVAKKVLKFTVGAVLSAERDAGAGNGASKRAMAVSEVSDSVDSLGIIEDIKAVTDNLSDLVDAVVQVLNALGMLDDKPGLEVNFPELISGAQAVFVVVSRISDELADE